MNASVIIPALNEPEDSLIEVLHNLTAGVHPSEMEIIIVNDGSINPNGSPKLLTDYNFPLRIKQYLRFRENMKRYGVGYSFDRGVEQAQGDILVLSGADILPERGSWLKHVISIVKNNEIGCGCSVGLQPDNYDINKEGLYLRYGAKILYTLYADDLPKDSPLRKIPDYRDILECKWMPKLADEPYDIPSVYGAFYWMKKEDYLRMRGFDTVEGKEWAGHRYWGCLESHLSLKARVYGIKCMIYPDFRVGHTFGRISDGDRAFRLDYKYWNKLWVAHTLLSKELRDECVAHLSANPNLNFNLAQSYIRQNWVIVQEVRERNIREGNLIKK
jgi:glycosyltransferase involved in cell wall biosynthesis